PGLAAPPTPPRRSPAPARRTESPAPHRTRRPTAPGRPRPRPPPPLHPPPHPTRTATTRPRRPTLLTGPPRPVSGGGDLHSGAPQLLFERGDAGGGHGGGQVAQHADRRTGLGGAERGGAPTAPRGQARPIDPVPAPGRAPAR